MTRDDGKRLAAVSGKPSLDALADAREDSPSEPTIDRASQTRIGDNLRSMYNELMQQPVPDRLMELLGRLDQGDREKTQ